MAELKRHDVKIKYTKVITEQSKISTNMERTPLDIAHTALMSFFDQQRYGENEIPETIEVDGQVFSYAEVRDYRRNRENS